MENVNYCCETCTANDPLKDEKDWGLCMNANSYDSGIRTLDGKPPKVFKKFYCWEHSLRVGIIAQSFKES